MLLEKLIIGVFGCLYIPPSVSKSPLRHPAKSCCFVKKCFGIVVFACFLFPYGSPCLFYLFDKGFWVV